MRLRLHIAIVAALACAALGGAAPAHALVVGLGASGVAGELPVITVPASPALPSYLPVTGMTPPAAGPCVDNAFAPLPTTALCFQPGGRVLHTNSTFALYWDPENLYFQGTKYYIDTFLQDVADQSHSATTKLNSPYAVTPQYSDATGRAGNSSTFRGAITDNTTPYPAAGCPLKGATPLNDLDPLWTNNHGVWVIGPDFTCLTDAQIQGELVNLINAYHLPTGGDQIYMLMLPHGVRVCLDGAGSNCSIVNFCSYHSFLTLNGVQVPYVVQPWTALAPDWTTPRCDEPVLDPVSAEARKGEYDMGKRIVSPLSAAHIATIVNPFFTGWFQDGQGGSTPGAEIGDAGAWSGAEPTVPCFPLGPKLDAVTIGANKYIIQREFNNGGSGTQQVYWGPPGPVQPPVSSGSGSPDMPNGLVNDQCVPLVNLMSAFVAPTNVQPGDLVALDGSGTQATLDVATFAWDFGDGTKATGTSVMHSYAKAGVYNVTLTVTDRGGNTDTSTQPITVGNVAAGAGGGGSGGAPGSAVFNIAAQLISANLGAVLHSGIPVMITSNQPADGFATILIPSGTAKRAHMHAGRAASVVIGRALLGGIVSGTNRVRIRLGRSVGARLRALRHAVITVRVQLTDASGATQVVDVARRY